MVYYFITFALRELRKPQRPTREMKIHRLPQLRSAAVGQKNQGNGKA